MLMTRGGVQSLTEQAGLSLRQLERHFDDEVGVSPRHFARVVRFNDARKAILQEPTRNLLAVAFDCRYTDYSHMTRDFQQFLGLTPARLRRVVQAARSAEANVEFLQESAPA
jgi:transcriptional regulator GlxA family with amidase domain